MESTLHRQLKERYGPEVGGWTEVMVEGFRVDAVTPDGRLVEIQFSPLGLLKQKLTRLLSGRQVGVVKPIVVGRRVVRRSAISSADLGSRWSPRRGALIEVFEELVGVAHLIPHANLTIELLAVEVDEIRVPRRRRPGYLVVDRVLREVVESVDLNGPEDLWMLLPADLPERFTTADLAERLVRPLRFAQQVAFCLRRSGAAGVVGKQGNHRIFERALPVGSG